MIWIIVSLSISVLALIVAAVACFKVAALTEALTVLDEGIGEIRSARETHMPLGDPRLRTLGD